MAEFLRLVPREPGYSVLPDLKELVRSYESGEREMPTAFVFVTEDEEGGSHGIFGYADEVRAVGLLTMAAQRMGEEI